jgi:adenylate cyclase
VVGYSRLMRDDEEATVRSIKLFRSAITKLVRDYRGHVVDAPGDNILSEFTSVGDAVNCAVEIQRDLAERNAELPEDRRMLFRIGIHLGDIIEEEGRIYGDGVNIAARMESLAEAGKICISGTVYDAIEHKLGLEYAYLGEQEVKNIDQSVRAYKVLSLPGAAAHRVVRARRAVGTSWRNASFFVIALLAVGLITLAVWNYSLKSVPQPEEAVPVETAALPLPDTPSLAVLPFVDLSRDKACEYLSDGITEDIITTLAKIPRLFIIARESVFEYKGKAIKVQQIGRELGVKHVLQGSLQKEGDRLRISAQLADAGTGRQIWAEHYDRPFGDIFALQDDITFNILEAMQVKLAEGEQTRLHRKGTRNMEAYIKVCQGRKYAHRFNREGNMKARQCAEEAVALDPTYAMAHYVMAKVHYTDIWLGMTKSPRDSLAAAFECTRKAIDLDNDR